MEQIVANPVPQILDGVQHVPRERVQYRVVEQGKSWSLLLVRSSATLVQASGDSTGGRAHTEQIVDVPVPQILEQNVEVIKVIPQEQCQRMRFFTSDSVDGTFHTCCTTANSHTPRLILSGSDGMFVVYHIREHTTIMTALCLCVARRMKAQRHQRARAYPRQSRRSRLFLHVFRQFHRLHSEWG